MSSSAYQDNPLQRDQMVEMLTFHKHVSPGDEKS